MSGWTFGTMLCCTKIKTENEQWWSHIIRVLLRILATYVCVDKRRSPKMTVIPRDKKFTEALLRSYLSCLETWHYHTMFYRKIRVFFRAAPAQSYIPYVFCDAFIKRSDADTSAFSCRGHLSWTLYCAVTGRAGRPLAPLEIQYPKRWKQIVAPSIIWGRDGTEQNRTEQSPPSPSGNTISKRLKKIIKQTLSVLHCCIRPE